MTSVFDKYPNLPGFATEFKDGGLQVRTETPDPGTESVLLLGTAIDGPVGEPIAIDPNTVELVFGGSIDHQNGLPNGATLVKAFYEAWQGGSRDIRLMRVTGSNASAKIAADPVTKTVDDTVIADLGTATGNKEEIVSLPSDAKPESVRVKSNGAELTKDVHYTVDGTALTVTIKANTLDVGVTVVVEALLGAAISKYTEVDSLVTSGDAMTLNLASAAKDNTLVLYGNGIEVDQVNYSLDVNGTSVTLLAGSVKNGAKLEARYVTSKSVSETYEIKLESIFAGQVYNEGRVEVTSSAGSVVVKIFKPESKKAQIAEAPLEYASTSYPSLGQLVQAINTDTRNRVFRASVANSFAKIPMSVLKAQSVNFAGGDNGVNVSKQELYNILGGARNVEGVITDPGIYHLLENYTVDQIVPLGVFADDVLPGKYDNFAAQLALACAVISHRNHATSGVISTSSPDEAGLAAVQAHVTKLLSHKNDYFMRDRAGNILKDSDGKAIDLGRFVSVVAGPDIVFSSNYTGAYADNSPAGYSGFVAQLPAQSAPTNKVVGYAKSLRFNYSNAQLDALTAARYVTFRMKNNQVAVVDGPTAAQPGSDYRRISTTRVVKEVVNELRNVCDPYIGEPNEVPQRNAMSAAISKRLTKMADLGVIVDYDFIVIATPQMQLMGEAQIELTIVPPQELRKITTVMSLRPSI